MVMKRVMNAMLEQLTNLKHCMTQADRPPARIKPWRNRSSLWRQAHVSG